METEDYEKYKKCSEMVEECMKEDRLLSLLVDELQKNKCTIKDKDSLLSFRCGNPRSQQFQNRPTKTVIGLETEQDEKKTFCTSLRHELLHSYDNCKSSLNPLYPTHMTCTEIHSYDLFSCDQEEVKRLAPVFDKNVSRKEQARARIPEELHQNCVWQLTLKSLMKNYDYSREKSTKSLEIVWNRCYNNLEPFGERQRLGPVDKE
ncbi:mitochondrial inner membrane protease ATP23 homolog [Mizuhopecten yessoensis]|uniref:mitochondrial inner membrane protease ATP23 homolog n=1 Tax=Mizuhopecten yessoensis TaxID=6573 RepID=UPI000B458297|nr:mitochondrial inner membrane protease ATP23 homolog [Mizuhopecten yessoensis]